MIDLDSPLTMIDDDGFLTGEQKIISDLSLFITHATL